MTRLGGLLADSKGSGSAVPAGCGLTPAALCPVVMEVGDGWGVDRLMSGDTYGYIVITT